MSSASKRHLQRALEVIEAARKGQTSLVNAADSLHFLLSGLEGVDQPWSKELGSYILTLESAGLASLEQQREMGEEFAALQTQTLDALESLVKRRMQGQ